MAAYPVIFAIPDSTNSCASSKRPAKFRKVFIEVSLTFNHAGRNRRPRAPACPAAQVGSFHPLSPAGFGFFADSVEKTVCNPTRPAHNGFIEAALACPMALYGDSRYAPPAAHVADIASQ